MLFLIFIFDCINFTNQPRETYNNCQLLLSSLSFRLQHFTFSHFSVQVKVKAEVKRERSPTPDSGQDFQSSDQDNSSGKRRKVDEGGKVEGGKPAKKKKKPAKEESTTSGSCSSSPGNVVTLESSASRSSSSSSEDLSISQAAARSESYSPRRLNRRPKRHGKQGGRQQRGDDSVSPDGARSRSESASPSREKKGKGKPVKRGKPGSEKEGKHGGRNQRGRNQHVGKHCGDDSSSSSEGRPSEKAPSKKAPVDSGENDSMVQEHASPTSRTRGSGSLRSKGKENPVTPLGITDPNKPSCSKNVLSRRSGAGDKVKPVVGGGVGESICGEAGGSLGKHGSHSGRRQITEEIEQEKRVQMKTRQQELGEAKRENEEMEEEGSGLEGNELLEEPAEAPADQQLLKICNVLENNLLQPLYKEFDTIRDNLKETTTSSFQTMQDNLKENITSNFQNLKTLQNNLTKTTTSGLTQLTNQVSEMIDKLRAFVAEKNKVQNGKQLETAVKQLETAIIGLSAKLDTNTGAQATFQSNLFTHSDANVVVVNQRIQRTQESVLESQATTRSENVRDFKNVTGNQVQLLEHISAKALETSTNNKGQTDYWGNQLFQHINSVAHDITTNFTNQLNILKNVCDEIGQRLIPMEAQLTSATQVILAHFSGALPLPPINPTFPHPPPISSSPQQTAPTKDASSSKPSGDIGGVGPGEKTHPENSLAQGGGPHPENSLAQGGGPGSSSSSSKPSGDIGGVGPGEKTNLQNSSLPEEGAASGMDVVEKDDQSELDELGGSDGSTITKEQVGYLCQIPLNTSCYVQSVLLTYIS
jgi:hypothetical protein